MQVHWSHQVIQASKKKLAEELDKMQEKANTFLHRCCCGGGAAVL
jgi:hypothetical protein